MSDADALDHARRLAAPRWQPRGASQAPTELYTDDDREPEHVGLRSHVERLREGLSISVEVQIRGLAWQSRAGVAIAGVALLAGGAFGISVVALGAVFWRML